MPASLRALGEPWRASRRWARAISLYCCGNRSPEGRPGLRPGSGQGPPGVGTAALARLLLTTLPPAVPPGLRGPHSPEDCADSSSGGVAFCGRS